MLSSHLNSSLRGNNDVARARTARPRGGHIRVLRAGGRRLLGGGRGVACHVPVAHLDLAARGGDCVVPVAVLFGDVTLKTRRSPGDLTRTPHRPAGSHLHPRRVPRDSPRETVLGPRRVPRQHHGPFLGEFLAALPRGNVFDEVDDDRSSGEHAAFKDPKRDEGHELVRDGVAAKQNE